MPFRERIKRVLTRSSASSTASNPSSTPTDVSRRSSNVYQPGEKMPPPKYRRPVAPEHKALLEAFSFTKAWRRQSGASQYSPMGSRMPSRKSSTTTQARRSHQAVRLPPTGSALAHSTDSSTASDDTDETGLSRHNTHSFAGDHLRFATPLGSSSGPTAAANRSLLPGQPWTQDDLTLALQRSNIAVPP